MKLILLLPAIVCFLFVPERAYGALPTCTAVVTCPANSNCTATDSPCTCDDGYHENAAGDGCDPDIAAGEICLTADSAAECVDHAMCKNVIADGETASLQCTCDTGYSAASGVCLAGDGTVCQTKGNATECVVNAVCQDVAAAEGPESLQCKCTDEFHPVLGACVADIAAGEVCQTVDSAAECVDDATCKNVTADGQPESLNCTCNTGYLDVSGVCRAGDGTVCQTKDNATECVVNAVCQDVAAAEGPQSLQCKCTDEFHPVLGACVADVAVGETCTSVDTATECVDHATCKNTQPGADSPDLKCMCDDDYHQAVDGAGKQICAADTCQHTVDRCKAVGMADCPETKAYIGCLLDGVCDPADAEQLRTFTQALQDARASLPANCDAEEVATCTQKVTGCFVPYLKEIVTCKLVEDLDECLNPHSASCTGDDKKVFDLANAYRTLMHGDLSCECVLAVDDCTVEQKTVLDSDDSDDAKCNAVKGLFTCAMSEKCNVSKAVDQGAVSSAWSMAMANATDTNCKNSITAEEADTCALQLTRCALIYGQDRNGTSDDRLQECKVAEAFGSCLRENTAGCTTDANKKLFTDQYDFVSATCTCENDINKCQDELGVVPTDPAVSCPKLEKFSLCLAGAKCDLSQADSEVHEAYDMYTEKKETYNCSITMDNMCQSSVASCSDTFITTVSPDGVSATQMCQANLDALLCVNAANCNSTADADLLASFLNASAVRVSALSCGALKCTETYEDVFTCKDTYDEALAAAGSDNGKKCTAMNNMVRCLRGPLCNSNLKPLVEAKYNELKKAPVAGCDMLPLVESGSSALRAALLPVLASVLLGWLVLSL